MFFNGKRSQAQDDNNYIDDFGTITHICPKCGTIYKCGVELKISCGLTVHSKPNDLSSYEVSTPAIEKICECGEKAMYVDNAMTSIVKILIDKKYCVMFNCEGHAYLKDDKYNYDFPRFIIYDKKRKMKIKELIPNKYFDIFNIDNEFMIEISCVPLENIESITLDDFNKYKVEMLNLMVELVNSLPECPFDYSKY